MSSRALKLFSIASIWILGWSFFIWLEFGLVFFILSCFLLMYLNTEERKSGLSAFSVFNKNMERLPGTLTTEDFEATLRGPRGNNNAPTIIETQFSKPKKIKRNELCYCQSGLKYKKCCERYDLASSSDSDDSPLM